MIAYIINGKSFGNCVDYVTRRALEERLYNEQSHQQKTAERKYEPRSGSRMSMKHMSAQPVRGGKAIMTLRNPTMERT